MSLHRERLRFCKCLLLFYAQIDLVRFLVVVCSAALVGTVNIEVSVQLHLDFPMKPFEKLNWQNASLGRGLIHFKIKQNTPSKLQELHWTLGSSWKMEYIALERLGESENMCICFVWVVL